MATINELRVASVKLAQIVECFVITFSLLQRWNCVWRVIQYVARTLGKWVGNGLLVHSFTAMAMRTSLEIWDPYIFQDGCCLLMVITRMSHKIANHERADYREGKRREFG
jgi:hypothetical protein